MPIEFLVGTPVAPSHLGCRESALNRMAGDAHYTPAIAADRALVVVAPSGYTFVEFAAEVEHLNSPGPG